MTPNDFCQWLKGYLSAIDSNEDGSLPKYLIPIEKELLKVTNKIEWGSGEIRYHHDIVPQPVEYPKYKFSYKPNCFETENEKRCRSQEEQWRLDDIEAEKNGCSFGLSD